MKKEQVEKFFQKYEQFFMQSLIGKLNPDEITELYAPEFIAASPMGVMTGKNDIDFQKLYPMDMSNIVKWERLVCMFVKSRYIQLMNIIVWRMYLGEHLIRNRTRVGLI